jgi:hypothetical protein
MRPAKRKAHTQGQSRNRRSETRTGEALIRAMRQAGKLGLRLRPARVPALLKPPADFSDDRR